MHLNDFSETTLNWVVVEIRGDSNKIVESGLTKEEAREEAERLNKIGDFSYVARKVGSKVL